MISFKKRYRTIKQDRITNSYILLDEVTGCKYAIAQYGRKNNGSPLYDVTRFSKDDRSDKEDIFKTHNNGMASLNGKVFYPTATAIKKLIYTDSNSRNS